MSELAKQLIEENKRTQNSYLDLGNCGLNGTEAVLAELAHLPHVTTLVFSNIWREYGRLGWVESQNADLPNCLVQLPTALPPHLQTLIIAGWFDRWKITDLSTLVGLSQLQSLNVMANQLTDLSPLASLSQLQSLDVSQNQLKNLSLSDFPQLQTLDVSQNQLKNLSLSDFPQLQSLKASENQLTDLSLSDLPQLQSLNASENQLTDLSLSDLPQLQNLDFSHNPLTDLSLSDLPRLQRLNVRYKQLTNLSLSNLPQLQRLDVSGNQLTNLSLSNLPRLQNLNVGFNQLTDLSPLSGLSQLQSLDVRSNQLTDLSPLVGLTQLQSLDVGFNQLKEVSWSFIKGFPKLKELQLYLNSITNIPPEIFNEYNCLKAVTRYFEDLEQGKTKIYQQKLLLIGNGRVGKTSLVRRWLDKTFDANEASTHAIQLRPHFLPQLAKAQSLDQVQLNIWDFGGQDIYHSTHRLFMQTQAIFVLVWDAQTEGQATQEETLEDGSLVTYPNHPLAYWLNYAHSLGQGSPVLLVQTKKARDGEQLPPHWEALKQQYPQVVGQVAVEASWDDEDDNGINDFTHVLHKVLRKQIKQSCTELPSSWWQVRQAIAQHLEQGQKTLSQPEFSQICEQHTLDPASLPVLRAYLHNVGFLFYQAGLFHNEIIIDQRWAIEAVYTLFDRKGLFMRLHNHGFFCGQDVSDRWDQLAREQNQPPYTLAEKELFVSFMESCQICVEVGERQDEKGNRIPFAQRRYLAPQLLPDDPIPNIGGYFPEGAQGLYMKVTHPFLHASVLHRFILRHVHQIDPINMKQHSAYLEYLDLHVLLEALPAQHAIVVRLAAHQSGQTQGKCARVLHHLREELREIQEGIEGVKEWASTNGKDYVLWEDLRKHPRDNPKIVASNGQHCDFADFEVFLTDAKPIHSHTMTNDPIPPEVKAELERMVTQEYKKVLRYRALKNDEINPEARQKRQQEIDLRLQNIEEIKQEFLGKIQNTDVHLSKHAIQQLVQEVVDRVVGGLGDKG